MVMAHSCDIFLKKMLACEFYGIEAVSSQEVQIIAALQTDNQAGYLGTVLDYKTRPEPLCSPKSLIHVVSTVICQMNLQNPTEISYTPFDDLKGAPDVPRSSKQFQAVEPIGA